MTDYADLYSESLLHIKEQNRDIEKLKAQLKVVQAWAWKLHGDLTHTQCGDGCNGCSICQIPDEACDNFMPPESVRDE